MNTQQEIVTKGEFARMLGVSPGRVSQYLTERKIHGPAIVGDGRAAKIVVGVARAQLRAALDPGQMLGNGDRPPLVNPPAAAAAPITPLLDDEVESADYRRERTRMARLRADQAEIELAVRKGELLVADEIEAAANKVAEEIVRIVEGLPHAANEIVIAARSGGAPAVEDLLKKLARGQRYEMAAAMATLAAFRGTDDQDAPGEEPQPQC